MVDRLDHEEQFLFKEEVLSLAEALAEAGTLDNVEDLLTDVITSPRFDSEVFTLERSLQVMLGARPGTTLVGLLTVSPDVFDQVAEVRIAPETLERLRAWRARFGLAIDNALNFLNNPDGIQGHDFSTQLANVEERRVRVLNLVEQFPNTEHEIIEDDEASSEDTFDYRVRRCRFVDLVTAVGHPELSGVFCAADLAYIEQHQPDVTLDRPTTLGAGDPICDFRFRLR